METAEGHELSEQTADDSNWFRTKKARYIVGAITFTVLSLLIFIVTTKREPGVNGFLNRAGLPGLPQSARNVRVDKRGGLFDRRIVFIRFTADSADMRQFVRSLPTSGLPIKPMYLSVPFYGSLPSWWFRGRETEKHRQRQRSYIMFLPRCRGQATVDNVTDTVWLRLEYKSPPLLRKIKRYIPFIRK